MWGPGAKPLTEVQGSAPCVRKFVFGVGGKTYDAKFQAFFGLNVYKYMIFGCCKEAAPWAKKILHLVTSKCIIAGPFSF